MPLPAMSKSLISFIGPEKTTPMMVTYDSPLPYNTRCSVEVGGTTNVPE
jgi:hypothetical protein